jgi:hypothetical protein
LSCCYHFLTEIVVVVFLTPDLKKLSSGANPIKSQGSVKSSAQQNKLFHGYIFHAHHSGAQKPPE